MSDKEAKALEAKNLGNEALKAGKADDAIKFFSAGLAYTPQNEVLFSNRAAAYAVLHQWENSLADAESAIKLKPSWSKAHARRGLALFQLNRAEDSLNAYKTALQLDPSNELLKNDIKQAESLVLASEMNVLGEEFANKKNFKLAYEHFKKATDLAPTSRLYWSNLANIESLTGQYDAALKSADRTIEISPYWHRGFQRKAEALSAMRKYAEALPYFAHCQKLAPDNDAIRRAFAACQQEAFNSQRRAEFEAAAATAAAATKKTQEEQQTKQAQQEATPSTVPEENNNDASRNTKV